MLSSDRVPERRRFIDWNVIAPLLDFQVVLKVRDDSLSHSKVRGIISPDLGDTFHSIQAVLVEASLWHLLRPKHIEDFDEHPFLDTALFYSQNHGDCGSTDIDILLPGRG